MLRFVDGSTRSNKCGFFLCACNLTKVLFDRLPALDKVVDMYFSDASGTDTFAYCNSKRCERLTESKNGNDPFLNGTNHFHVTGGALEFTVQKEDDGREIIVKIHKRYTVHVERIWIFIDTSSGNNTYLRGQSA